MGNPRTWLIARLEQGKEIPEDVDEFLVERARQILAEQWLGPRETLWSSEGKRRRRVRIAEMINACSEFLGEDPLELPSRWDRLPVHAGRSHMQAALRRAGI